MSNIANLVLSATNAETIERSTIIQSLWSGYGQIVRLELGGGSHESVILKHIKLPEASAHPRGWNTEQSHQRKIRSYKIEALWYQRYASLCEGDCAVPECLAVSSHENETLLVLTDLDSAGFSERKSHAEIQDIHACLSWLASFHATFLDSEAEGLWECGTYWHLDTRPDELAALSDTALQLAAPLIDQKLKQCHHQTLVHGDAKLANFCFRPLNKARNFSHHHSSCDVAAVDFQYIGRGCGMKDVAYFIGSCLSETDCGTMEGQLLDFYFSVLAEQVTQMKKAVDPDALEREWRELYPVAWADFHRFIKGWSPGHWKINSYSERVTADVIKSLQT